MEFPKDHYTHDTSIEWWYFWGRLNNGDFFHFATFRGGKQSIQDRASHWSLHNHESHYFEAVESDLEPLKYTAGHMSNNNTFYLESSKFGMTMTPNVKPIVHPWTLRNYYSIPSLTAEGHLYPLCEKVGSDVWMDHEFGSYRTLKPWDWVAIKLNCGMNLMASQSGDGKISMIELKGKSINSDFILDDRHLYFHDTTIHLTMKPLVEEKIFHPEFGMPYSEVPFEVIGKGEPIGYGIRERSYGDVSTSGITEQIINPSAKET